MENCLGSVNGTVLSYNAFREDVLFGNGILTRQLVLNTSSANQVLASLSFKKNTIFILTDKMKLIDFCLSVSLLVMFMTCMNAFTFMHAQQHALTVSPSFRGSRLSGPAPLAVFFDGSGTRVSETATGMQQDSFRDVLYSFNFGDPNSGIWGISRLSKNMQTGGPFAAHVFNTVGTFIVSMSVTTKTNVTYHAPPITITVQNPSTVWTANNTICVSTSSNFNGCPSGSVRMTTLPTRFNGKRVLLRRGETFGDVQIASTDDQVLIGTYSTGLKPQVSNVRLSGGNTVADWPDDITIMDLNITNSFGIVTTGSRILLYRCILSTPSTSESQVDVASALKYYMDHGSLPLSSYYWPHEIFIVENNIQGELSSGNDHMPVVTLMGYFMNSVIMGNQINKASQHSVRLWAANQVLIAHNSVGGDHDPVQPNQPGIRHAIKIHSNGLNSYNSHNIGTTGFNIRSSKVLIADNKVGTSTYPGSWLCAVAPQNALTGTIEGIEDVLLERNVFIRGRFTTLEGAMRGRRISTRYNSVQGGVLPRMERIGFTYDPALNDWDGPYYFEDGSPMPVIQSLDSMEDDFIKNAHSPCQNFYASNFTLKKAMEMNGQDLFVPSMEQPQKNTPSKDPTHQTCVLRVSDPNMDNVEIKSILGSKRQLFNSNNTLQFMNAIDGTWHLYRTDSNSYWKDLVVVHPDSEPHWHPTRPNLLYYLPSKGVGMKIHQLNIESEVTLEVTDLSTRIRTRWPSAHAAWTHSEGSPSRDARFWCFMVEDSIGNTLGVISYDVVQDQIVGFLNASEGKSVKAVTTSPSGQYCVLYMSNNTIAYSLDFTQPMTLHQAGSIDAPSDLALNDLGEDVYVSVDTLSISKELFMVNLRRGQRTTLFPTCTDGSTTALRVSGKGYNVPGWVVISTFAASGTRQWLHDKILLVPLNVSKPIYAVAHHHSVSNEIHVSVNKDLTMVAFSSHWDGSQDEGVDIYRVEIPTIVGMKGQNTQYQEDSNRRNPENSLPRTQSHVSAAEKHVVFNLVFFLVINVFLFMF
ncbi:hypothetical protein C9374_002253 [Naegleria lovaniensis]|uniref:PKD domain-containing protein n=1 Tax=Naegleria lovaniensis TaxID=51637 RepID=A0AA88GVK0_NAELO|nr:uncharacterized protein C9374_002253 [Naegleria lovaniensis]KAG2386509.1 hypothetical protein C9374_002253 [Naegleria lovaniensis]